MPLDGGGVEWMALVIAMRNLCQKLLWLLQLWRMRLRMLVTHISQRCIFVYWSTHGLYPTNFLTGSLKKFKPPAYISFLPSYRHTGRPFENWTQKHDKIWRLTFLHIQGYSKWLSGFWQLVIHSTLEIGIYVFFYLVEQNSEFCYIPYRCSLYMCTLCDSANINTIIKFVPTVCSM